MARPRIYDEPRVATAVRLPISLRDELRQAATARDVSVNLLITRAVADFLTGLPDPLADAHGDAHASARTERSAPTTSRRRLARS